MTTVLVTGANRGIGFELAKQGLDKGHDVIAVCRGDAKDISQAGARVIAGIDITVKESLALLEEELGDERLDIVINNAGVLFPDQLGHLDRGRIEKQLQVNATAPLLLTQQLLPRINSGGKVVAITSRMGSIEDNTSGGYYGYRMSKAALNAAFKSLALDLKSKEIAVAILHPGFVRTGMTGNNGNVEPAESASQLWQRVEALNLETSGSFWHANGEGLPW